MNLGRVRMREYFWMGQGEGGRARRSTDGETMRRGVRMGRVRYLFIGRGSKSKQR